MRLALAALLLLALGGCVYCGPGAGDAGARDMVHGFCTEL